MIGNENDPRGHRYMAPPPKKKSFWSLIGWEAEILWIMSVIWLISFYSPSSNTDIERYQLNVLLNINYILIGIAGLFLGSVFAILSVIVKTRTQ
jgi:hypothetical protein